MGGFFGGGTQTRKYEQPYGRAYESQANLADWLLPLRYHEELGRYQAGAQGLGGLQAELPGTQAGLEEALQLSQGEMEFPEAVSGVANPLYALLGGEAEGLAGPAPRNILDPLREEFQFGVM